MPSVLFICIANSFRSQMAEAIARSLGGSAWEVASAGSRSSGIVHPMAQQLMEEIGLDLSSHHSKGLEAVSGRQWDYVVTMGCGDQCPTLPAAHRLDWALPDPAGGTLEAARHIRDHIAARVQELMARAGQ